MQTRSRCGRERDWQPVTTTASNDPQPTTNKVIFRFLGGGVQIFDAVWARSLRDGERLQVAANASTSCDGYRQRPRV